MTPMQVIVLGCGTSHGVPMIGCECDVCQSKDPKNSRNRPAILVTTDEGANLLVDTPPEMRIAFLREGVKRLDAIFYTHSHADHIYGMDDVRTFNYRTGRPMPIYAEPNVLDDVKRIYKYIFVPTQAGGGKPSVALQELTPGETVTLGGQTVLPLRVFHGTLPILAYKFGPRFVYLTDVSRIPDETWPHLQNLDVLMLDATRREPHPTHFHFDRALEVAAQIGAKRTLLTHLAHDYDYATTNPTLPPGIELAFDGQKIEVG